MHVRFIYQCLFATLLAPSTILATETFYRNQAIETSATHAGEPKKSLHRKVYNRFRQWKEQRRQNRLTDETQEDSSNDHMSASVGSIDSVFIGASRDTVIHARHTMSHYGKELPAKYYQDLSQIPTEDTAFAIYLKDALIGYDERDLALLFFAFRIGGRPDLIAVLEPHLAERVRNRVNNDIERIWPLSVSDVS